jgi:hypothetical protein
MLVAGSLRSFPQSILGEDSRHCRLVVMAIQMVTTAILTNCGNPLDLFTQYRDCHAITPRLTNLGYGYNLVNPREQSAANCCHILVIGCPQSRRW